MGKTENEDSLRRFMTEIWSKGDMDTIDELMDPDFKFILAFAHFDNAEAFKKLVVTNRTVFEGLTYVPNDIVADETKGAVWWTMSSKHVGTWRNVPGSNKDVSIEGVSFFWFTPEGKFAKAIVENDVMGLMRQIGGIKMLYE
ncbi:MAG TPA: ester cyclase [Devosiaceae bacterium]|nr:ester cyclase [Devosiaceae bacterium]